MRDSTRLIIITALCPALGVYLLAGCEGELFLCIFLCLLGAVPGLCYALWIAYVYYDRREDARRGIYSSERKPGIFSERVLRGGLTRPVDIK
ncbi:plasma membrane proteolipid 3 [Diplodia corticola]|uniref:Plasma membrane proteolipid 3 n=1 Tax=Diplodia corticola TaxID=236234 RepID=A0A1J9QWW0_9PEZI|nr:plasma membrane proteolipid 3 [Diplodia corticola]OJD33486.1 plasma membrane proteolipid 3 [Diplodia corticola]